MDKPTLRKQIRAQRKAISDEDRTTKNQQIQAQLESLDVFCDAETILFYVSTNEEVDTQVLIQRYLKSKTIIVPSIDSKTKTLELCRLGKWSDLMEGHFGVLEIPHNERIACHPDHIDLIIVPGIAFDPKGHRIGYGKGYYDEMLTNHSAPTIGLAYELQMVNHIPTDPHDIPVMTIITEQRIIQTHS